ncbi:sugar transferase [Lactobacillus sp. DCY120]|uniref:Sugar transferase n=1 Tax=Bombilactobacillus apium TaxID=2675299 RepID=A0A850RBN5_9LACO|nr:sugar transferase [Bombilactobacillus apium]NVY96208.1 sugar transferase [Bombilactobacillus apium]
MHNQQQISPSKLLAKDKFPGKVGEHIQIKSKELDRQWGYRLVKRLSDIVLSGAGLVVLLPVFLILAGMIKLDDPQGPIFFRQTRIGKKEKRFQIYKLRSMCVDAEAKLDKLLEQNEVEGAMFKIKDDPRVTKVGHFLRRTSLDELPQLWNVLKGDMSLVGPRPPLPHEVADYTDYDKQRLLVIPGCTGLWQVSERNEVGFYEMVELDLAYIRNRSIWNDLKIIFRTLSIMVKPNGY